MQTTVARARHSVEEGNGPLLSGDMATNHRCDHVEELCRHGDDTLSVGFRRRDDQEGDHLAVRPLVLPDAELCQLDKFLDPYPAQPQCLHVGPIPEGVFFCAFGMNCFAGGEVLHTHRRFGVASLRLVSSAVRPAVGAAGMSELFAGWDTRCGLEKGARLPVFLLHVLNQRGQKGLPFTDAVVGAFLRPAAAASRGAHLVPGDGARYRPDAPPFWLFKSPALQIKVEPRTWRRTESRVRRGWSRSFPTKLTSSLHFW